MADQVTQVLKISHEKPPNWSRLVKQFDAKWGHVVVTYGDTCYCRDPLSADLFVHETVHLHQQAEVGIEQWWERFYIEPAFRVQQELQAYRAQYRYLKQTVKDRNMILKHRDRISMVLSGKLYGNCITYHDAFKALEGKG